MFPLILKQHQWCVYVCLYKYMRVGFFWYPGLYGGYRNGLAGYSDVGKSNIPLPALALGAICFQFQSTESLQVPHARRKCEFTFVNWVSTHLCNLQHHIRSLEFHYSEQNCRSYSHGGKAWSQPVVTGRCGRAAECVWPELWNCGVCHKKQRSNGICSQLWALRRGLACSKEIFC